MHKNEYHSKRVHADMQSATALLCCILHTKEDIIISIIREDDIEKKTNTYIIVLSTRIIDN